MSRTDTWMPLYIGDYLADTGRLTTLGHGAYMLILMDYWRNGAPPDDDSALAAIARVDRKIWDRELRSVIRSFFKLGDDGLLHQKRLDTERAHAIDLSEKRRVAAQQKKKPPNAEHDTDRGGPDGQSGSNSGGSKPTHVSEQLLSNSSAIDEQTTPDSYDNSFNNSEHTRASRAYASPSPLPLPSKKDSGRTPKTPIGTLGEWKHDFAEFYAVYPRKKAPDDALKAYIQRRREGVPHGDIMAGLRKTEFNLDPTKIKYPAGWLRAGSWKDLPDSVGEDGMDPVLRAAGVTQEDIDRMFGKTEEQPENPTLRFLQ